MTFSDTPKFLQGPGSVNPVSTLVLAGSTSSGDTSFIWPFIIIQSGTADNLAIGGTGPSTGSFTTLTSSTFDVFSNTIGLGTPSDPRHGLTYGTNNFFGNLNDVFTNTIGGTLGSANFSSVLVGTGGSSIGSSGPDLTLSPGPLGNLNIPFSTRGYRPFSEHIDIDVQGRSGTVTASVSSGSNVSFFHVSGTPSDAVTVSVPVPSGTLDGQVRIAYLVESTVPSVQLSFTNLQDPGTGVSSVRTVTLEGPGSSAQFIYNLRNDIWGFLDTGSTVA